MLRCAVLIVTVLGTAAAAQAQAVQLPSVDVFSVDTVVSVPDRGSMVLGGVRNHAQGRATAGPFRSGTAWGQASAASSASAHVWIHDFEAMDAELLAQGRPIDPSTGAPAAAPPVTRADRARAHLARVPSQVPIRTGAAASTSTLSSTQRSRSIPDRASSRPLTVQPLQYNLIR